MLLNIDSEFDSLTLYLTALPLCFEGAVIFFEIMEKKKGFVICVLSVLLLVSLLVNHWQYECLSERKESVYRSDTIVKHDTIRERAPIASSEHRVRTETVVLKVVDNFKRITPNSSNDVTIYHPTLITTHTADNDQPKDSAAVEIPITQKLYSTNKYKAWVSGYKPSLDSIEVYQDTKVINNYIQAKKKRWSVGIGIGYGYNGTKMQPYVGVNLSYAIFKF